MKLITFTGSTIQQVRELFNMWARGKAISRDVLIRERICKVDSQQFIFLIYVFYDEVVHKDWWNLDDTKSTNTQP